MKRSSSRIPVFLDTLPSRMVFPLLDKSVPRLKWSAIASAFVSASPRPLPLGANISIW